jgi:nucleoside-diphosphate-sugar epimerase
VGKCYLVSDREDVSTADLIRRLRSQLNRPARLMPVPPAMLRAGLALAGQGAAADRLLGSLQVDASRIARDLGWSPPYGMDDGLADTIAWYRGDRAGPGTRPGAVS